MNGAGVMLDAINILKNNRRLLPKRKSFKDLRDMYYQEARIHPSNPKKLKIVHADKAVMLSLRKKLKRERRLYFYKQVLIVILTLILGAFVIYWVIEKASSI